MNKVCIGRADSSIVSSTTHVKYSVLGTRIWPGSPGIPPFGKAIIDYVIAKTEKGQYGIKHAVGKHWVRRVDEDSRFLIYDIFVNLNDKDYLFWKIKYG